MWFGRRETLRAACSTPIASVGSVRAKTATPFGLRESVSSVTWRNGILRFSLEEKNDILKVLNANIFIIFLFLIASHEVVSLYDGKSFLDITASLSIEILRLSETMQLK